MGARFPVSRRGSVLVIVMVSLLFATFALVAFLEKASVDLLVEQREAAGRRLRMEAYSALEVVLAVLNEFREVGNGLRSPSEGWAEPLAFAGYEPGAGREVTVTLEDESGRIPLPRANAQILVNLFRNWELPQVEAESLADALLGWMKRDHVYTTALRPMYDSGPLPYEAPGRPLRSYRELAAIDKVRDAFYDAEGRPNDLWRRFADSVSLLDFPQPNLNGAKPDTLAAYGRFDAMQQRNLGEYLEGKGAYQNRGPRYFQNTNEVAAVAGPTGDAGAFGTTVSALRVLVTVKEGRTEFRLLAVVASPGGATTVRATAAPVRTTGAAAKSATERQAQPKAGAAAPAPGAPAAGSLRYPFVLLEMRENDEIPAPPPPSSPSP